MTSPRKVDLDDVLINEIGQFGKFQLRSLLLLTIPYMLATGVQDYIFAAGSIPTRCHISECDSDNPEYSPEWILNAVPGKSLSNIDNCNRYVSHNASESGLADNLNETCPVNLFDRNETIACDSYVYGRTNTVVYDFHLECQEWLRALIGTLGSIGNFIVLSYTGMISDRFGRKFVLFMNSFTFFLIGIIKSFSSNYIMYAILQFLQSALGWGASTSCYVLATELVGPRYRVMAGLVCNSSYAVGQILLASVAWIFPEWRSFLRAIYLPHLLLLIPCCIYIEESVRWLINKQNFNKAEAILRKVAKVNGRDICDETLEALFETKIDEKETKFDLREVFNSPQMIKRMCIVPFWWITASLIAYGLSINSTSLSGNMYVNFMIVCAVEIPGMISAYFLMSFLGRKWSLFSFLLFCSVCQFSFLIMPADWKIIRTAVYMFGKLCISGVFGVIYVYTAELYPTKFRHTLFGFSSMIGRLGAIAAPLTPALAVYWSGIPSLLFGVMALISAMLALTTPDTKNTKLPDTVQEATKIGLDETKYDQSSSPLTN